MPRTSLTKPELQILEVLWTRGACSIREIHEALPAKGRPAFTTVQTVVYRLEKKQALRCVKRISKANIVEAVISRDDAHTTLVDELLGAVWRPSEAGDGAARGIGPPDARRHQGSRGRAEEAPQERRVAMTPWLPSALLNHLWQSTLFVIVVWLAALALRHNGARVRCWLWMAASVKFLVPLSVLVSLGEQFQWRDAPAAVQPAVSFVMEDVLTPAAVVVAACRHPSRNRRPCCPGCCWPSGASERSSCSCHGGGSGCRSDRRCAARRRCDSTRRYGAADLAVMSSPSMPEPGVVGIRRPRLLLPEGIVERLTPAQLRALIAHERCHIRCHDNLAAAIHMVVEAIFWFHPAVWWIEARLVDERERACDEAVLRDRQPAAGLRRRHSRSLSAVGRRAARLRGRRERLEPARARGGDHAERDRTPDDAWPTIGARRCGRRGRGRTSRRRCADGSIAGRRPSVRSRSKSPLSSRASRTLARSPASSLWRRAF